MAIAAILFSYALFLRPTDSSSFILSLFFLLFGINCTIWKFQEQ